MMDLGALGNQLQDSRVAGAAAWQLLGCVHRVFPSPPLPLHTSNSPSDCLASWARKDGGPGGWSTGFAHDTASQLVSSQSVMTKLVMDSVVHDIPLLLLHFSHMTADPGYLHQKLATLWAQLGRHMLPADFEAAVSLIRSRAACSSVGCVVLQQTLPPPRRRMNRSSRIWA